MRHVRQRQLLLQAIAALLLLGAGCEVSPSGGGPGTDGGAENTPVGNGEDPGGDLPALLPGAWGAPLSEAELEQTSRAISEELDRLRPTLPESPADRAQLVARALPQIPNVRLARISRDSNVTVQLRDGTPILLFTRHRPAGGGPPALAPVSLPEGRLVSPPLDAASPQATAPACTGLSPSPNDQELPPSNKTLLVDVQSLGGSASAAIAGSLRKKGYQVETSSGSLSDLRGKVKDLAAFWIATHGGFADIQLGPDPSAPKIDVFAIATGEQVVFPCEASPDCVNIRKDYDLTNRRWALLYTRFVDGGPMFWVMTREFVKKYWSFDRQSIVYIDGCSVASSASASATFRTELKYVNAGHFLGWDDLSTVSGSAVVSSQFFDAVTGANLFAAPSPKRRPFDVAQTFQWMTESGRVGDPFGNAVLKHEQFTGKPVALAPSIKAFKVDEDLQELTLFGDFGTVPGVVMIDNTSKSASWSAHQIVVSIDSSSEGPIIAKVRDHESNAVPLTTWRGTMKQTWVGDGSFGPPGPKYIADCNLHFRADVHPYRCSPGGATVRGPRGDGQIGALATRDTTCTWNTSGSGTRSSERTDFPQANGPLPWYPTSGLPRDSSPQMHFLALLDVQGGSQVSNARISFQLTYVNVFTATVTNIYTGTSNPLTLYPMFNSNGPLLGVWYPLTAGLDSAQRTVPVQARGDQDTRTLDYQFTISAAPGPDTEG